jgi:hypothetical protein
VRRLSHAKVAIGANGEREAKLYLLVEHRVLSELWPGRHRSGVSARAARSPLSRNP